MDANALYSVPLIQISVQPELVVRPWQKRYIPCLSLDRSSLFLVQELPETFDTFTGKHPIRAPLTC